MQRTTLSLITFAVYASLFLLGYHFSVQPQPLIWLLASFCYWSLALAISPHFKWIHLFALPSFLILPWQWHWYHIFGSNITAPWLKTLADMPFGTLQSLLYYRWWELVVPTVLLLGVWLILLAAWWNNARSVAYQHQWHSRETWRVALLALCMLIVGVVLLLQEPLPEGTPAFIKTLQQQLFLPQQLHSLSLIAQPWPFGFYIEWLRLLLMR